MYNPNFYRRQVLTIWLPSAVLTLIFILIHIDVSAQEVGMQSSHDINNILPLRERIKKMSEWRRMKIERVLPEIMRDSRVDMWVVRKSEDALFFSLLPMNPVGIPVTVQEPVTVPPIIVFYDINGTGEIEYIEAGNLEHLKKIVIERDPPVIAVENSSIEDFKNILPGEYNSRLESSYYLGVRWIETQLDEQISAYRHAVGVTHDIIAEALSNNVIIPDVTTSEDVKWWLIHTILDNGLSLNNPPSITHYRSKLKIPNYDEPLEQFGPDRQEDGLEIIIRRGDIVRFDIEPLYLGFGADTHQMGYVLDEGESNVPEGLKRAMRTLNRVHDIMIAELIEGKFGDEMYHNAQTKAELKGIKTRVIMHPVLYYNMPLYHGFPFLARSLFGAGTSINSDGGSGESWNGQHTLNTNTVYAMEPYTMVSIPEWGRQEIELGLGEVVVFTKNGFRYLDGRQTEWYLIK